jgi:hypothetical protein
VLWQQVSHLLLKYTKSGYGTVLTAAWASQGCSATDYFYHLAANTIIQHVILYSAILSGRNTES